MKRSEAEHIVFSKCPELFRLYSQKKNTLLSEYILQKNTRESKETDQELIEVVKELATAYINTEAGNQAEKTLRDNFSASTADHHGIVSHPFSLHTFLVQKAIEEKPIIAFSCASISLDNSSFPKGLFWHTKDGTVEKFSFFEYKKRRMSVFSAPAIQKEALFKKATTPQKKKVYSLLNSIWEEKNSYKAQSSYLTYMLSKKIISDKSPFILVDQESIVLSLIRKYHLKQKTYVQNLLTNKKWHDSFQKHFFGKRGAFSEEKGTFLFWYINPVTKVRERFFYTDGFIETKSNVKIKLSEEELATAIEEGYLMPSMALSFIVLTFYYELDTPGGFLQIDYLGELKAAWIQILTENTEVDTKKLSLLETNKMKGDFGVFWGSFGNEQKLITLADLILTENISYESWIKNVTKNTTVKDAIDAMISEYLKIVAGNTIDIYENKKETFNFMHRVRE